MNVRHQVAGYDKKTERLAVFHPLPGERSHEAERLAHMGPEDDGLGTYPLDPSAVIKIGSWIDRSLPVDLYDWFLEPL